MNGKRKPNHLINEKSPYLKQHAYNPVEWHPWGEEAFALAKKLNKPIWLSIGYATCHWCHVMEKESFDDVEIASVINQHFVAIKVDREELPEVDSTYMQLAQAMLSSSVGWPLNVILTPDLNPFAAVTYLPPVSKMGLTGILDFIDEVQRVWAHHKEELYFESARLVETVKSRLSPEPGELSLEEFDEIVEELFRKLDPVHGGLSGAPKFPMAYHISSILSLFHQGRDSRALFYTQKTLSEMWKGGIHDHLGGGFSRYTVDAHWMVPHFEKMLYDNAFLLRAYVDAWRFSKEELYRFAAKEIAEYLLKELALPWGGFASGEDADSEGEEGLFYTWSYEEIEKLLSSQEKEMAVRFFGITQQGNFHGRNILHTPLNIEEYAEKYGIEESFLIDEIVLIKSKLLKARNEKKRPFKDTKIVTAWNAFAVEALLHAGLILQNKDMQQLAKNNLDYLLSTVYQKGILYRCNYEGKASQVAILDDYVALIKALLAVFEWCGDFYYLELAMQLSAYLNKYYKEDEGFYQTKKEEAVLMRNFAVIDEAEPSSNAVHLENLLKLFEITHDHIYLEQAEDIIESSSSLLASLPQACTYLIKGVGSYFSSSRGIIVVILDEKESNKEDLIRVFSSLFLPHLSLVWKKKEDLEAVSTLPYLEEMPLVNDTTTVYICIKGRCLPPIVELDKLIQVLQEL